jgi:hypothetical protein
MTNISGPTAEPAPGSPNIFMSDLMNSLRRLERVGDENSKTTQKLINAAADVSRAVATLLADLPDGTVLAPSPFVSVGGALRNKCSWHEYFVEAGRLMFRRPSGPQYVAEDREAAFAFSKDVHSGLIQEIAANLKAHDGRLAEDLLAMLHSR